MKREPSWREDIQIRIENLVRSRNPKEAQSKSSIKMIFRYIFVLYTANSRTINTEVLKTMLIKSKSDSFDQGSKILSE